MTDALLRLKQARKIGIVLGGGSVRCAFQIGVIEGLVALGVRPALVVAVSGGVWNGAALAAGTEHRLRHYWRSFSRMPRVNVSNLFREHSPFIFNEMHRRTFGQYVGARRLQAPDALPMFVALTRLRDRASVIIDVKTVEDPLKLLLAANYLPPYYTHTPPIASERYGDGGITNNCPYEVAFEHGCDAVVLVSVKGESEGGLYRSTREVDHHIPQSYAGRMVVIRPRHRLPLSFTETRWDKLRSTIDLGYLRTREILLEEDHAETRVRTRLPAPTLVFLRLLSKVRRDVPLPEPDRAGNV